jgi:hypothetical protein
MDILQNRQPNVVKRLAALWSTKIKAGVEARKTFDNIADQCRMFMYAPNGFLWDEGYRRRFKIEAEVPKFQVTINKLFELVAIVGPYIYWDYADRKVSSLVPVDIVEGAFGEGMDQQVEQLRMEQQFQANRMEQACKLFEKVLNHTQRSQRNGGLISEGRQIVQDFLMTGWGIAWPEVTSSPGLPRKITGCYRMDPKEMVVDPDCSDPTLESAGWVGRRRITPHYQLERMFGRKPGSLKQYATVQGTDAMADQASRKGRKFSQSFDHVVWFEIYSKCGIGFNLSNSIRDERGKFEEPLMSPVEQMLDDDVQDFAYVCVIPGHDVILNLEKPLPEMTSEEVQDAFRWPFQSYKADRWPFAKYACYSDGTGPYPIAPLAPALGHLICISVLTAAYVEKAWTNRKDIIAVLDTYYKDLTEALKSNNSETIVKLSKELGKPINELIQFLQRPDQNYDILKALEWETQNFRESSGLYEVLYAASAGIERSAEGTKQKAKSASIRPDDMSAQFGRFMGELAYLELLLMWEKLDPDDVVDILGVGGDMLWQEFVLSLQETEVYRMCRVEVSATDMRRPDRDKELADLKEVIPVIMPMLQLAAQSGTPEGIEPINVLMRQFAKALNWKEPIQFAPIQPPAPPPEVAEQQTRMTEAEIAKTEADAALKGAQAQAAGADGEGEMAMREQELEHDRIRMDMELEKGQQEMALEGAKGEQQMALDGAKARQSMMLAAAQGRQQLDLTSAKGALDLKSAILKSQLALRQQSEMGDAKVATAKKMAAAKPKTSTQG